MEDTAPLIAAIDIGTNSFHMVIASVNDRGMMKITNRSKEMVRLGSSGGDIKWLEEDAIKRGVETLRKFVKMAKSENAQIKAVATSAVREARNSHVFLNKVKEETGINIEVVSGAEEGRLIYQGIIHALPVYSRKTLLLDIGGGSTETIVGLRGETIYGNSEKLGAIRLMKRFFPDGNSSPESIDECRKYIYGNWAPIIKRIRECDFDTVVGTSGTITNIAVMCLAAKGKTVPGIINGIGVTRKELLKVINDILNAHTVKKRANLPGMDTKRADIITGGALILEQAILNLDIQKILISSYALREGIVFETVQKKQAMSKHRNLSYLRYETIYSLANQYRIDIKHAEHVRQIALQLFDDLEEIHGLSNSERELLEAAAILHDAGYHISHDKHHKHSYYLIRNSLMPGFTNNEAELIANIARYHRKSHPKKKHKNFHKLNSEQKEIVRLLGGILRIAEGVDRRQLRIVRAVHAGVSSGEVTVEFFPAEGEMIPDIELWGAERRKPLLEETLGRKINFKIVETEEIEI